MGLTAAEQARVVDLTGLEEYCRDRQAAGMPQLYWRAVTNPPGAFDPEVVNGGAWRAAEVPAINGHGTARGAAGLYAALLQGKLVSAALLGEATAAQCSGMDAVIGQDTAWGLGFGVDTDGFGMGGSGGSRPDGRPTPSMNCPESAAGELVPGSGSRDRRHRDHRIAAVCLCEDHSMPTLIACRNGE